MPHKRVCCLLQSYFPKTLAPQRDHERDEKNLEGEGKKPFIKDEASLAESRTRVQEEWEKVKKDPGKVFFSCSR